VGSFNANFAEPADLPSQIIKELETPGQQKQKKITTKHIYFNRKQPFTTTSVKKLFSKYNKRA
jgi:hypothetical protein